jgi:predicted unusual protein kinase regulating ubiquinone biosynthesis (AarF/ABC1/UbiB family)
LSRACVRVHVRRYVVAEPGARREVRFWSVAGPCVARYVWLYRTVKDPDQRRPMAEELHARYAKPIVNLFMELGGPYVKLGQYLSVRPEIVPHAYRVELKKLQSDVPGKSYDDIRPALGELEAKFASIEKNHFGAASIGQVHKATLHDGRQVAVKVQYVCPSVWCLSISLLSLSYTRI